MNRTSYKVFYDTNDRYSGTRRGKEFETKEEAIDWANVRTERHPVVVEIVETVIWRAES